MAELVLVFSGIAAIAAIFALLLALRQTARLENVRLRGEQTLAAQTSNIGTLLSTLAETERGLNGSIHSASGQLREEVRATLTDMRAAMDRQLQAMIDQQSTGGTQLRLELTTAIADMRAATDLRLRELREGNEAKLAEIQKTVNEQLHEAVEKQMSASFERVVEQFAAVQKTMGEMQAIGAQIGDIKRLFGNVKTRGGWGETQVRAMLDDVLPEGSYDINWKPRADSDDSVEFAIIMPMRGSVRPRLPIDAKFPVEDYERMLNAAEAGDADAEKSARRALERRIRDEAKKLQSKYIHPPATVEFAVMYLPTDGLYTEVARIPGLIDQLGRENRVLVLGPSLFPALVRTIQLGHVTLALEEKADEVRHLLSATRNEMGKMDSVLAKLEKQVGTVSTTLGSARQRTRAVQNKLKSIEVLDNDATARLLGPIDDVPDEEGDTE